MSFQHFRLGDISIHQPLPPHLTHTQQSSSIAHSNLTSTSQFPVDNPQATVTFTTPARDNQSLAASSKQPYGSGDTDDGYTLVFPNLQAFSEWRQNEEETQMVEFVKGDTHGSKAVPPRFKDHTKLVCARHSRSGRKKYVKKHPERVRKVPSRKLEGQGCLASISYKTYYDTEEVRACYVSQHSHEIGLANLPYTRRGRKAVASQDKERPKKSVSDSNAQASGSIITNSTTSTSSTRTSTVNPVTFSSAVSMLAPLPPQPSYSPPAPPQSYGYPIGPVQTNLPQGQGMSHERWDNMATLFHHIREHARGYEYPMASVAVLESVLIRLYLESPVGIGVQPSLGSIVQNMDTRQPRPASIPQVNLASNPNPNGTLVASTSNTNEGVGNNGVGSSSDESS